MSALLTTRTADLGLYVAAAAALAGSVAGAQATPVGAAGGGPLALADLVDLSPGWRSVAAAGLLVAAAGKAAQLPFSYWLSDAMAGPSPVSALLHSAAMVAMGGYLLLRVAPLLAATGWAATAAAWLGALSALALGAVAIAQTDLKQTLAASTVAQLGYVVLAAGVGAVGAGAAQLAAHAATKSLLFLGAGIWSRTRGGTSLTDMAGAARDQRLVGVTVTVGALALAGVPPLSLWATKDAVLAATGGQSMPLYGVGVAGAALSAAYAARIVAVVWAPRPHAGGSRAAPAEQAPLVVLAGAAAGAGLLVLPPRGAVDPSQAVGSALLALVVTAGVFRATRRGWSWAWPPARDWLGLPAAVRVLVTRPVMAASALLDRLDHDVVEAAVEGVGRGGLAVSRRVAAVDVERVDGAVRAVGRGVRAAGAAARRPQTGLIHQYYAQALLLLAGLVVIVWLVR
jgi:NADH:ubiquinone oxidoreductase subunit 5 (subunit L)/multisubunit Na+/H+ antiporter MnhA subunit